MKVLFISDTGSICPIAARLARTVGVQVYIHNPDYAKTYDGMIPKVSLKELRAATQLSDTIIIDADRKNSGSQHDAVLLKMFALPAELTYVFGSVGKVLSRDHYVIGAATFLGDPDPPNTSDPEGRAVQLWLADGEIKHCFSMVECRHWLSGSLGPTAESQSISLWKAEVPDGIDSLVSCLNRHKYTGPCKIRLDKDGKPTERLVHFTFDDTFATLALLKTSLADFLIGGFEGKFKDDYAACERITIQPYPYVNVELKKAFAEGVAVDEDSDDFWAQDVCQQDGKIICAGQDGLVGTLTMVERTLPHVWGRLYHRAKHLRIGADLQYRIDGFKVASKICGAEKWATSSATCSAAGEAKLVTSRR